jgi:ABC-type multidrug transport system fused ATPase/permease subunit
MFVDDDDDKETKYLTFDMDDVTDDSRSARERAKFQSFSQSFFLATIAAGIATGIVVIAFMSLIKIIGMDYPEIDRANCTCDCWDGLFKGHYGRGNQPREVKGHLTFKGHYKRVFWNFDSRTGWMLLWTMIYSYAFISFVIKALQSIVSRKIRWHVLAIAIIVFFQFFYNFWCVWNYLNDEPLQ